MSEHAGHETQVVATLSGVMTDLVQIAERIPARPDQTERVAQILDCLAVEITEAAAMLRAATDPPPG